MSSLEKDENPKNVSPPPAPDPAGATLKPVAAKQPGEQEQDKPVEISIDTSKIRAEMREEMKGILEAHKKTLDLERVEGQGTVAPELLEYKKMVEETAARLKENPMKEQWMVPMPGLTTKELTGHLRDFCFTTLITKGKAGDVVNVPYVKDFDFEILASVGAAFSDSLGDVFGTTVTALQEAGGWTRIAYKDIEKINSDLLSQINNAFKTAALRAEDEIILEALDDATTNLLAGAINRSTESTGTGKISATDIPQAIGKLLIAGKAVEPGQCCAYLTGGAYAGLLEDIAANQPFAYTSPQYLQTGKITELMGVHIVVGAPWAIGPPRMGATGTCYACYIGRWKRGVILAPKRELLLETEKDTVGRTQTLTGSHTIGLKILDPKEFCRINTSQLVA